MNTDIQAFYSFRGHSLFFEYTDIVMHHRYIFFAMNWLSQNLCIVTLSLSKGNLYDGIVSCISIFIYREVNVRGTPTHLIFSCLYECMLYKRYWCQLLVLYDLTSSFLMNLNLRSVMTLGGIRMYHRALWLALVDSWSKAGQNPRQSQPEDL